MLSIQILFISNYMKSHLNLLISYLENYSIPPTTTIMIFPYIIHRNEDVFSNSEEFIPERFLDDENNSKFLSAYIPFSAGPRNCIGNFIIIKTF